MAIELLIHEIENKKEPYRESRERLEKLREKREMIKYKEELMNSILLLLEEAIKLKASKRVLVNLIDGYREYRREYISMEGNPKQYDDRFIIATISLNNVDIN